MFPESEISPGAPAGKSPGSCRMIRMTLLSAMVAATALAGGCANYQQDHMTVSSVPDDYRTRHPIVVGQSEISEDIVVSVQARELSYRDRAVVEDFAGRFQRSGSRSLAVLIPRGSANTQAARRLARQAVDTLVAENIDPSRIQIHHYAAAEHGNAATLRLVYSDITAEVPGPCGQWPKDLLEDSDNRNYENFGCATQNNLAAMVANPADLLGPRGVSEIDATRRTTVIEAWREDGTANLPALF